jgi:PIN domain nuclease of toxin-antitoxin system
MAIITDRSNRCLLSVASAWEMQIKYGLGKLNLEYPVQQFVGAHLHLTQSEMLPVYEHHIWALADLPLHHRDPFDRLLIAQAMVEDCTLVTADTIFDRYPVRLLS